MTRRLDLLAMRVERSVGETFAFVLAEELTLTENDVVDLGAGTSTVKAHPFLFGLVPLPVSAAATAALAAAAAAAATDVIRIQLNI